MTPIGKKVAATVALTAGLALGVGGLTTGTAAAEPRYGAPCTDQNGAPGYYIWENPDKSAYNNTLICNITGNAPRGKPKPAPAPPPFGN